MAATRVEAAIFGVERSLKEMTEGKQQPGVDRLACPIRCKKGLEHLRKRCKTNGIGDSRVLATTFGWKLCFLGI